MLLSLLLSLFLPGVQPEVYTVDTDHLGPVFDGVGALSGGGATSKLLFSINKKLRKDVLKTLFKQPGGVHILKVELGGDDQSTDGSEASHWPEEDVFDFRRGYEWRLVKEAVAINPQLKVCVLPWAFPSWVGHPMKNPEKATKYVVSWIVEAYRQLKVKTYCVGLWNERQWTQEYAIELRKTLDKARLPFYVNIVAGDNYKTSDEEYGRILASNFTRYVDIIGVHYPGGKLPEYIRTSGKTLWASEDYSTMEFGFGCMARTLNWNYALGNMTGTIVWHLTSAFYESFPYFGAGLMSPSRPDYSSYSVTPAYRAFWATSAFVQPGWRFLKHGYGSGKLSGGGTYVSYTNGRHFTLVLETMSFDESECYYSNPRNYTVADEQLVSFSLEKNLNRSTIFKVDRDYKVETVGISDGVIDLGSVPKDSLLVITTVVPFTPPSTVVSAGNGSNCEGDYFDDYSDYEDGDEARWLAPQKGSWLVFNGSLIQTVISKPLSWCAGGVNTPIAVMSGTSVTVDVLRPSEGSPFPFIGIRTNCTGCEMETCVGLFAAVGKHSGFLFTNFSSRVPVASFDLNEPFLENDSNRFMLKMTSPTKVLVTFGRTTRSFSSLTIPTKGMVALGLDGYGKAIWDNLFVENAFNSEPSADEDF